MTAAQLLFALLVLALTAVFLGGLLWAKHREKTSTETTWENLVARLDRVNRDAVHAIAADLLERRRQIAPEALFGMLGGLEGLERLAQNCEVLIELATYVQRWHPEALVVAEELRLSAREMKWHVERLHGAAKAGHLRSTFPDNAQQAVRVYYSMTRKVLTLVEDTAFVPGSSLQHAL